MKILGAISVKIFARAEMMKTICSWCYNDGVPCMRAELGVATESGLFLAHALHVVMRGVLFMFNRYEFKEFFDVLISQGYG